MVLKVYAVFFDGLPLPDQDKKPLTFSSREGAHEWISSRKAELELENPEIKCGEFSEWVYRYIYHRYPGGFYAYHEYRILEINVRS